MRVILFLNFSLYQEKKEKHTHLISNTECVNSSIVINFEKRKLSIVISSIEPLTHTPGIFSFGQLRFSSDKRNLFKFTLTDALTFHSQGD